MSDTGSNAVPYQRCTVAGSSKKIAIVLTKVIRHSIVAATRAGKEIAQYQSQCPCVNHRWSVLLAK